MRLPGFEFEMCIHEVLNCKYEYSLERDIYSSGGLFLCSKALLNIFDDKLSFRYQFEEMYLHWSPDSRTSSRATLYGSEHSVNGHFFPAEIQAG